MHLGDRCLLKELKMVGARVINACNAPIVLYANKKLATVCVCKRD